jgi:hypothetical protein
MGDPVADTFIRSMNALVKPMLLNIATWNIGGGIPGESHQRGGSPSLEYYASILSRHTPDIVCLQEAHEYYDSRESQSEFLARSLGYPYAMSFPASESHFTENAALALGILSRFPIRELTYRQFPNPQLEATGPNGEKWRLHDKGYVVGSIDLGGRALGVVNGHFFPLHHFGACPTEPAFAQMWSMLVRDLLSIGRDGLAVAAIDANYGNIGEVLADVVLPRHYSAAFECTPTTSIGVQKDHILYGHAVTLVSTKVAPTESDHSYCQIQVLV